MRDSQLQSNPTQTRSMVTRSDADEKCSSSRARERRPSYRKLGHDAYQTQRIKGDNVS
ncbi:hypothetical protein BU26DRAFT_525622 [Trematosphaeria pertusa]|uniref:Uncharacterized protein n=1 Tax=Trematosphaeria pertusa TaxID=390896 RepID=A0A6A6HRI1_9PLEO|nr:uncharacterized protein BU26DRAFT_525622 [Trematosphaeria pertusa]KAF2240716.1 hypothetical protein BU26DRAFT_525622 [Trematosphaeria pertusa]